MVLRRATMVGGWYDVVEVFIDVAIHGALVEDDKLAQQGLSVVGWLD